MSEVPDRSTVIVRTPGIADLCPSLIRAQDETEGDGDLIGGLGCHVMGL